MNFQKLDTEYNRLEREKMIKKREKERQEYHAKYQKIYDAVSYAQQGIQLYGYLSSIWALRKIISIVI